MAWEVSKERHRARVAKKLAKQPPPKPLMLRNGTRSSQQQSRLLALPAELRLMIWERVVGGKLIVLHRKDGKMMHYSMDLESATNATAQITRQTRHDATATPTTRPKAKLLALLQACQMTYLESIKVLYQANTFICLDYRVLRDLCRGPTGYHMPLIRSLQIHFNHKQFPHNTTTTEAEGQIFRCPWHHPVSETLSTDFHQVFPNLHTLSIFLRGHLFEDHVYEEILGRVRAVYQHPISVQISALKLPKSFFARNNLQPMQIQAPIVRMLVDSECRKLCIVPPSRDPLQYPAEGEDKQAETDMWRAGRLSLQSDNGPEKLMTLYYAVLIPEDEKEVEMWKTTPPLLWDAVRT
ncbi:hypothetical protein BDW02DRAFT_581008 [Decorospora gaudefroyi]|uniref:DUF7730 domain-containing protein n=1 Tax=Decorospora gaudefroyi TaxID=184978 RepID=A0A6A5KE61_9PLEO|nr:hypothetical protein BDW02DRAFT_581008 [Decorospora gaudefroyi]